MRGLLACALLTLCAAALAAAAATRIETQSAHLRLVGILRGERLVMHLTRLEDNAPLADAVVAVSLRGTRHPALAEADGGYSVTVRELALPGPAALQFEVTAGTLHEVLNGTLAGAAASSTQSDHGSARGTYWWVLNFGVCIAFLWLFSRRKKRAD